MPTEIVRLKLSSQQQEKLLSCLDDSRTLASPAPLAIGYCGASKGPRSCSSLIGSPATCAEMCSLIALPYGLANRSPRDKEVNLRQPRVGSGDPFT
jgi:hypothetical protein